MRIKSFSTEQFAGICDRRILFTDGMNVVLGDNEAGKSTIISAMYYALNQPVKINKTKKSDKDFLMTAFPTSGEDTIDATVYLRTTEEEYKVEKIWDRSGAEETIRFKPQNSGLLRGAQAENALKELREYGEAVYNHLIFGRQSNETEILEWCYRFFSPEANDDVEKAKKKIREAFSAVGGISPDKFKGLLEKKLKDMSGHWDFDKDCPEDSKRGKTKWSNGIGTILKAYYDYEEARVNYDMAVDIEAELEKKDKVLIELMKEKSDLDREKEALIAQKGAVLDRGHVEKLLHTVKENRKKAEVASDNWEKALRYLKTARQLKEAQEERDRRERKAELLKIVSDAKAFAKKRDCIQKELEQFPDLEADTKRACELSARIKEINNELTAAKLRARISIEQGYKATLAFADGKQSEISGNDTVDADGYIKLSIPGVATLQVAPQELDVEGLLQEKSGLSQVLEAVFAKYSVSVLEMLSDKDAQYKVKRSEAQDAEEYRKRTLNGKTIEYYQQEASAIITDETICVSDTLDEDIRNLLKMARKSSLDFLIGTLESDIRKYEENYHSLEELPAVLEEYEEQQRQYGRQLGEYADALQMTEQEYNVMLGEIRRKIKEKDVEVGKLRTEIGSLSTREVTDISGLVSDVEQKKAVWLHEKEKYNNYSRIRADFLSLLSEEDDPLRKFYTKFNEYLSYITGERISLRDVSEGLCLQSESNGLNAKELLSEGTKKTVLLAFRLAVLDDFFPDGGGFVVLDDVLLDMDPARRTQAAKLLNQFAKTNQVIFTTCDPAIADLLGGNRILV